MGILVVLDLKTQERLFNILAGFSVLSWAVLGTLDSIEKYGDVSLVRACLSLLHFCVSLLFFFRSPLKLNCKFRWVLLVFVSFIACGVSFSLAPALNTWPVFAEILFLIGTLFTLVSLAFLGKSFAVLPALREIVGRGSYRIIRHPCYFGELLMLGAYFISHICWGSVIAFSVSVLTLIGRVSLEEKLLSETAEYQEYQKKVKWRLVPGLW